MTDPALLDMFQRLGMALAIGFLVGVERGWKHREAEDGARAAGLRTHAIIGLLGGVCGAISLVAGGLTLAALILAFIAPFMAFKLKEAERDRDLSATGAMAGLLVFALGIYCVIGDIWIAAAAGVALTALLSLKDSLHAWLKALTAAEINSALLILAMSAIALPLLPDRAIDPWGAVNPRELWVLTIFVAGASFAGYIAVRLLGEDVGLYAGAAAGAMVSSTVVTAELGRRVRADDAPVAAGAAAANLAAMVSLGRVTALTAAGALPALTIAGPALVAAILVFGACAFLLHRSAKADGGAKGASKVQSPLDFVSVLQFAALLGVISVVGKIVAATYGEAGLLPLAATAGLADVDAVTLATGSLVRSGLNPAVGAHAILVAALVNTFSKAVVALLTGGWRYAGLYAGSALLAALAGGATFLALA
ncbi:MAG: DUF4010 domain-containing protein [Terricaulis sp.]